MLPRAGVKEEEGGGADDGSAMDGNDVVVGEGDIDGGGRWRVLREALA